MLFLNSSRSSRWPTTVSCGIEKHCYNSPSSPPSPTLSLFWVETSYMHFKGSFISGTTFVQTLHNCWFCPGRDLVIPVQEKPQDWPSRQEVCNQGKRMLKQIQESTTLVNVVEQSRLKSSYWRSCAICVIIFTLELAWYPGLNILTFQTGFLEVFPR